MAYSVLVEVTVTSVAREMVPMLLAVNVTLADGLEPYKVTEVADHTMPLPFVRVRTIASLARVGSEARENVAEPWVPNTNALVAKDISTKR